MKIDALTARKCIAASVRTEYYRGLIGLRYRKMKADPYGSICLPTGAKLAHTPAGWVLYGYLSDGSDIAPYLG